MSADPVRSGSHSSLEREPVQTVRDGRLVEQYRALRAVIEAAGPKDSDRLPGLIRLIRAERERSVVIAPPLGQAADALFLAPHVDGVVLVVAPGKTGGPPAVRARDGLLATGARLYGVVLGEAEPR
jgi:Mrp family chromosome partitioning ATPase